MKRRTTFPCIRAAFPILAALLLFAGIAHAEDQRFVSDDVFTWGDLGGIRLAHTNCDGSLDRRAIDGFDVPGEWIAWRLTLTEPFCFVDSLRNAGTTDDVRHFVTEFILETTVETVSQDSVLTPPGRGLS